MSVSLWSIWFVKESKNAAITPESCLRKKNPNFYILDVELYTRVPVRFNSQYCVHDSILIKFQNQL